MSAEGYRSLEARSSGAMYLQADKKNAEENRKYVNREIVRAERSWIIYRKDRTEDSKNLVKVNFKEWLTLWVELLTESKSYFAAHSYDH